MTAGAMFLYTLRKIWLVISWENLLQHELTVAIYPELRSEEGEINYG
jgi:hypothetical protein